MWKFLLSSIIGWFLGTKLILDKLFKITLINNPPIPKKVPTSTITDMNKRFDVKLK